ncbi:MAG: hypothetical protein ACOCUO_00455 [archaeon]
MSEPDELPKLEGIDASRRFREYIAELREAWPPRPDLEARIAIEQGLQRPESAAHQTS